MTITSYEEKILRILLRRKGWLNTTQIANLTGISWNTAIKYLLRMYNRGWLSKKGNYWRARR